MSAGIVVIIIVVILVVVALVAAGVSRSRRRRLQERFGPEYDRVVEESDSRRKAEAELTQRERRVKDLDIRPLDPAARARYADLWSGIQERFVDMPQEAVTDAQRLVVTVMTERGYPTEHEDQVIADLSVEHARTLDHYRAASSISGQSASGGASTEDLRQAMIHYRALFQDLLGEPTGGLSAGEPVGDLGTGEPVDDVGTGEHLGDVGTGEPVGDVGTGEHLGDVGTAEPVGDLGTAGPVDEPATRAPATEAAAADAAPDLAPDPALDGADPDQTYGGQPQIRRT